MAEKMERIEIVAIGKGKVDDAEGHIALTAYLANAPAEDAYNMGEVSEEDAKNMTAEEVAAEKAKPHFNPAKERLVNALINRICDTVDDLVDSGFIGNINVHTLRQGIVLKYYEEANGISQAKAAGVQPEDFDASPYFQSWHTDADKAAITRIGQTALKALYAGCFIHFQDASLIPFYELEVPKTLEVPDGLVVDFENGVAKLQDEDGMVYDITVRNFPTFARKNAQIIKMRTGSAEYPVYTLKRSLGKNKSKLEQLYADLWDKLPDPKKATATQKGSLKGLVRKKVTAA